ncbi:MAG TPA: hypothetical protein VFX28_02000, partial [Methylomirabilota bacterium]|nr:hypothetical protein [Methylomirabilota bacterium]
LCEGPQSTADLGRRLGLSPGATTSLVLMLAAEGKVRVASVELADAGAHPGQPHGERLQPAPHVAEHRVARDPR